MKRISGVCLGLALVVGVLGWTATASAGTIVFKVAHVTAQDHPIQKGLEHFRDRVAELTNGEVTVDIYSSGVLGGDQEELQQVILGTLDMAVINGISIWGSMDPRAGIEELPFIFKNEEHAYKNLDGKFGDLIRDQIINPSGVTFLNYWENGFRHFTNSKNAIVEPKDMQGIKFRSAESEIRIQMFNALGSSAIPMPFPELFTALQQKTIDGQENPLTTIWASKFYEVQKYLTLSGHIYSACVFIINPALWNSLSPEIQAAVQQAADEARDFERALNAEQCASMVKKLEEVGMVVSEIDKDKFIEACKPVWDGFVKKFGSELIDAFVD
ncbi:MAG: DctP family TRAP transporter solute-binding subunit [Clostridium sp.]|nr:DctP family TRAP transporter solute-binding subunit [Clostridium sp.]